MAGGGWRGAARLAARDTVAAPLPPGGAAARDAVHTSQTEVNAALRRPLAGFKLCEGFLSILVGNVQAQLVVFIRLLAK